MTSEHTGFHNKEHYSPDCPRCEQDMLLTEGELRDAIRDYYICDEDGWFLIEDSYWDAIEAQLAKVKTLEQKGLDRPKLREEVEDILIKVATEPLATKPNGIQDELGQILAFFPDIEEAKREERERIATIASFTVKLENNTVVVDKYDWDRLWQALKRE